MTDLTNDEIQELNAVAALCCEPALGTMTADEIRVVRWRITRTWDVEAPTAMEAIELARVGQHRDVHAQRLGSWDVEDLP